MEKWFSRAVLGWYARNKRDLPWRKEKDAYKIWLSEIILQQTQVVQGLGYYLRFTEQYPTVKHLALAPEDEVLRLWQGLGYYSRARNLHHSARSILKDHKGRFPDSYEAIRTLKGVGDYTAAAIASFAFGLPHAVVDGNVYRLLSRVFGIMTPIDSSPAKKEFTGLAEALLDRNDPATYNQAIMEFGSQYCRPVNPDCPACVLSSRCYAYKENKVGVLPVKAKKTRIRNRYLNYLVVIDKKNRVLVRKRTGKDIWEGLYEFLLLETEEPRSPEQLSASPEFSAACGGSGFRLEQVSREYKHILSHQHLYARFYVIRVSRTFHNGTEKTGRMAVPLSGLDAFGFPRLMIKFLEDCDLKEIT
jgi:A/G-specific adenine glycosylase